MSRKSSWLMLLAALLASGCSRQAEPPRLEPTAAPSASQPSPMMDGIYLVVSDDPDSKAGPGQARMEYQAASLPTDAPSPPEWLVLQAEPVVEMALTRMTSESMKPNTCGTVSLEFAPDAADNFALATGENVGRRMAVVIGGEVVSAHKIRERIDGGAVTISCCNPAACSRLVETLGRGLAGGNSPIEGNAAR